MAGLLQCRVRGRYRLGWRVVELNETLRGTVDVRSCAAPVLDRLVDKHGETTHLAVMGRGNVLYVDKILGNHNITVQGARVGARLDAHATAVGKVLLAQLEQDVIAAAREVSRAIADATDSRPATFRDDPAVADLATMRERASKAG